MAREPIEPLGKPWGLMCSTVALVLVCWLLVAQYVIDGSVRVIIAAALGLLGYCYIDAVLATRNAMNKTAQVLNEWERCERERRDEMRALLEPHVSPEGTG